MSAAIQFDASGPHSAARARVIAFHEHELAAAEQKVREWEAVVANGRRGAGAFSADAAARRLDEWRAAALTRETIALLGAGR